MTMLAIVAPIAIGAAPARCNMAAPTTVASGPGCASVWLDHNLRLNDVLTIGTHNSYKQSIPPEEFAAHRARDTAGADSLDYGHRPLTEQLDRGMRQIELDVWDDPAGGRWLHPPGALRSGYAQPPCSTAADKQMSAPGFKVMHLADIDFRSSCVSFVACLTIVHEWSSVHPRHTPIMILINAKDGRLGPGSPPALLFDGAASDRLDAEVRRVFASSQMIVPDDVQGAYPTLRDAVHANQWPTLERARGRVFFVLDETAEKVGAYRGERRSLEGRAMFVNTDEQSPAAAYITLNDPLADAARIAAAVDAGLIVRTRADADTREARANDPARRDAALRSGAQYVSTDYFEPDPRFGAYAVRFDDHAVAHCNPRRAATKCAGAPIE
jgi:calcium-dependent phosphoinositide phospholipase C